MLEPVRLFEILMKASAALVTFGFGAVVLSQAPNRNTNRFLAVFLFLISANQLVETLIVLQKSAAEIGAWAALVPPMTPTGLDRLALIFAAADPFVLYYFASIYPRRSALNRPLPVAVVFAGSALFLLAAQGFVLQRDRWLALGWETFTAIVYLVVWGHFARLLFAKEPSRGARPMFLAMSVAALPLIPRVGRALSMTLESGGGGVAEALAAVVVPILVVVVALVVFDRTWGRSADGAFRGAAFLAGTVMVVGFMPWFQSAIPSSIGAMWAGVSFPWFQASAALRWLIFSLLVSVAVFRHDILGMKVESRRRAARGSVAFAAAIALLFSYAALSLALSGGPLRLRVLDVALVGTVLALAPDVRRFVTRRADRLYGVPAVADRDAAADTYRAAVQQARRDDRLIPMDTDLARLRRSLDIDAEAARWLELTALSTPGPRSLEVGETFHGRYRVVEFIGRGGSGRVFMARDPLLHRDVVLKEVLETTHLQGKRLLAEAQAAAKVRHPNVVALHDVIAQTGRVVMVTEFLPMTLEESVQRNGLLPLDVAGPFFVDVAAGLEAIHAADLVHRDLKPANIFVTEAGNARIGDFGVALQGASPATLAPGQSGLVGTPGFLAPELLEDGVVTPQVDVYALARTIERCVDDDAREALGEVIARGQARDPGERFASAFEMLRALEAALVEARVRGRIRSGSAPLEG